MAGRVETGKCVILPNFVKTDGTTAELWRFNDFLQLAAMLALQALY